MKTSHFTHFLAAVAFTLLAQAQVGPQATQLPACIKACDPAAIASVNCTNADQYCHCVRQTGILANITPCADATCGNPSASLYTFTTLFGQVCAQFNISVPVVGSNSSANGTNVTLPAAPVPSTSPYTGLASGTLSVGIGGLLLVGGTMLMSLVLGIAL